jgi:hypothetical protein
MAQPVLIAANVTPAVNVMELFTIPPSASSGPRIPTAAYAHGQILLDTKKSLVWINDHGRAADCILQIFA